MKIFLTGSTGFLGKSIKQQLQDKFVFFCYERGSDIITDLNTFNPDVIIHSAAEIYSEIKMYESNVILTRKILDWVKSNNSKMIYFGSSSEYGYSTKAMSETDICAPTSLYGLTKLIGTEDCLKTAKDYNRNITVLRPFSVYGKNEPDKRLIPTLRKNLTHNLPITLIEGTHDFIHIDDFVRIVELIIECNDLEKTQGQIYNAGRGQSFSNREIYEAMKNIIAPTTVDITFLNKTKPCDSPLWLCDNIKLQETFNFNFKYTVEKGLQEYIIYYEHDS